MKSLSATKGLAGMFAHFHGFALCTALIFMGGIAGLQDGCNSGYASPALQTSSGATIAAFGMSSSFSNCSTVFRFYWFAFAFVTVTLISVLLATGSRMGLHYACNFVTNLVAICVVLMMVASEAFTGYETVYDSFVLDDWWHARFRSTCAGAIMTVVWLILLLMAVGTDWEHNTGGDRVGDKSKVAPAAPPAPGVAPPPAGTAAADTV